MTYRSLFEERWFRLRVVVDGHFVTLFIDNRELITGILLQEVILQAALFLERLRSGVLPLL